MSKAIEDWEQRQEDLYLSSNSWLDSDMIKPQKASNLISGFPDDNITLEVGDGGVGKGFVSCHVAAAVTTGSRTIFDEEPVEREPGRVLLLNAEDSYSRVITQRLTAAGADHRLIKTYNFRKGVPDIPEIIAGIEQFQPKLVILDPLQAFLSEKTAMERRNAMRKALSPLQAAAERNKCAVLIVMHTNKRIGAFGRDRCSDSSDIWDIARSVFIMGDCYDGEHTKYISHEKYSYGMPLPTQLCRIDSRGLYKVGETDKKDRDYIHERDRHAGGRPAVKRDQAEQIIIDAIRKNGKSISGRQLAMIAVQNDIRDKTFRNAKANMIELGQLSMEHIGQGKNHETIYRLLE